MKNKNFTQEIILITIVLIISYLIYSNVKTIDLFTYLFTTKDIIGKEWMPFLVFINISLLLLIIQYIAKQILQKFKSKATHYILICLSVLCILLLNVWTPQSNLEDKSIFIDGELTIYPPLSALNEENLLAVKNEIVYFETGILFLQIVLIVLIILISFTSFLAYKNRIKIVKN
jgi:hypothetical protein